MPHISVKCFGSRHAEKNATENEKARIAVREEVTETIKRIQGGKHGRMMDYTHDAQHGDRQKPEAHNRPEGFANPSGALGLNRK